MYEVGEYREGDVVRPEVPLEDEEGEEEDEAGGVGPEEELRAEPTLFLSLTGMLGSSSLKAKTIYLSPRTLSLANLSMAKNGSQ